MFRNRQIDHAEGTMFWKQLASLLRSGMPLPQALDAVGRDSDSEPMRRVMVTLREAVEEGETLSSALRRCPHEFSTAARACVRAGERTGDLPGAAEVLAAYGTKTDLLRLRARMVLAYPMILFGFTVVVTVLLAGWAVPLSNTYYENLGTNPPIAARIAVAALAVLYVLFAMLIAAAALAVLAYRFPDRLPGLRMAVDRALLAMPYARRYYRALVMARFTRTLALLLSAGVPLHEAVALAGPASGNSVVAAETAAAASSVRDGERLTRALQPGPGLPASTLWALRIAEERGDFEETLGSLADYFDDTAEIGASTFLTTVEPIAVAVVGILSAATIVALATPTFSIYSMIP